MCSVVDPLTKDPHNSLPYAMASKNSSTSTIAYIDCFSGISGDMFLGALLDAGLPEDTLQQNISFLELSNYELVINKRQYSAISSTGLTVEMRGTQHSRNWPDIQQVINKSSLNVNIKTTALAIFLELAKAEATVHKCSLTEVHFHEVGALDSIIDIVGAAIGLDFFQIDALYSSALPMPSGWVRCQHGKLPLPAPAVCELTRGLPVYGVDIQQEMVTPTGAAIIKALAQEIGPMPPMKTDKIGYGAGSRPLSGDQPNLLRLLIGAPQAVQEEQEVIIIETNLDDYQPEISPYISEKLFAIGALDVVFIPVQMKKGRPGCILQVMADNASLFELQQTILSETSAIGLRYRKEKRVTLPRRADTVITDAGKIRVKVVESPTGRRVTPEYEDCARAARESGRPIAEIYRQVTRNENISDRSNKREEKD